MKIYAIKNEKLNFFNRPVYVESSNEALSYIQNILMSDADRVLIGLRSDLALYEIGEIDFVSGFIRGLKKPEKICTLESVFDSIPDDKVPQNERAITEQLIKLTKEINDIKNGVLVND